MKALFRCRNSTFSYFGQVNCQFSTSFRHQEIETDQVGEAHGEDHGVGKINYFVQAHGGPQYDAETENQFVGEIRLTTSPEYECPSLLAVVRPCDHGGKGEQKHG